MRLSRIEIENFKGIGAKQVIDLRPITLLFGPNSAGKSTILQALHYVREILERGNADPDETIAGGLMDLGGFTILIHNHDLTKEIAIKVVVDLSDEETEIERLPFNSGEQTSNPEFADLLIGYVVGRASKYLPGDLDWTVKEVGVLLRVRWSAQLQRPYVSELAIDMNAKPVVAISSRAEEGWAQVTGFNFAHPLLQAPPFMLSSDDEELSDGIDESSSPDLDDDPMSSPLGSAIWDWSRAMAGGEPSADFTVGARTKLGALPDLDRPLWIDLKEPDLDGVYEDTEWPRRRNLPRLLDELLLGPARIVRDYLQQMTYVGPLRAIPPRNFQPKLSPDESRWAHGLAAWDLLYADVSGDLVNAVNEWLADEQKLGTSYRLERLDVKEVATSSLLHQRFARGLSEDDLGEIQDLYGSMPSHSEVALRDMRSGIVVAPSDVGVGISQMIPVMVCCLRRAGSFLAAVEQPELHIHPAVQLGLGDLFISAIQPDQVRRSAKSLLIETHSEHIILRLLRRIRETATNELPPSATGLLPEDLSVFFVEPTQDGVRFRPLQIDTSGDFLDRWPKGFFEERDAELF